MKERRLKEAIEDDARLRQSLRNMSEELHERRCRPRYTSPPRQNFIPELDRRRSVPQAISKPIFIRPSTAKLPRNETFIEKHKLGRFNSRHQKL